MRLGKENDCHNSFASQLAADKSVQLEKLYIEDSNTLDLQNPINI